jgi:hypothetical protein
MQDFAPFTPELLGALTPGRKNAGLIGQLDKSPHVFLVNTCLYPMNKFYPGDIIIGGRKLAVISVRNSQKYLVVIWTT